MTIPLLIPLEGGPHFGPPWGGGASAPAGQGFGHPPIPPFAHLIGAGMSFLFLLLLIAAALFLLRRGRLGPPAWVRTSRSPEAAARTILAERFARGEISSDEFMERASVLNWTPGSDAWENTGKSKRKGR